MAAQGPMEEVNNQIVQAINQQIMSMSVPAPTLVNTYRVFEDKTNKVRMVLRNVDEVSGYDLVGEPDTFAACLAKVNDSIVSTDVQPESIEFRLTQESLGVLLFEGVPAGDVEAIKPLVGQSFSDADAFFTAVAAVIGIQQAEWYKRLILSEASRGKTKQ